MRDDDDTIPVFFIRSRRPHSADDRYKCAPPEPVMAVRSAHLADLVLSLAATAATQDDLAGLACQLRAGIEERELFDALDGAMSRIGALADACRSAEGGGERFEADGSPA